jgi:hypothetical protein
MTLINSMKRRHLTPEEDEAKGPKFLMYFRVERLHFGSLPDPSMLCEYLG